MPTPSARRRALMCGGSYGSILVHQAFLYPIYPSYPRTVSTLMQYVERSHALSRTGTVCVIYPQPTLTSPHLTLLVFPHPSQSSPILTIGSIKLTLTLAAPRRAVPYLIWARKQRSHATVCGRMQSQRVATAAYPRLLLTSSFQTLAAPDHSDRLLSCTPEIRDPKIPISPVGASR